VLNFFTNYVYFDSYYLFILLLGHVFLAYFRDHNFTRYLRIFQLSNISRISLRRGKPISV